MNIFISMSVFELFNKLDKHLQDIIKLYYLSYGTRESNMMKSKINEMNQYKLNQPNPQQNLDDLTIWRYHIQSSKDKYLNFVMSYQITDSTIIYCETQIAYFDSDIYMNPLINTLTNPLIINNEKEVTILYYENILRHHFRRNHYQAFWAQNKFGTPTSMIMRKYLDDKNGNCGDDYLFE